VNQDDKAQTAPESQEATSPPCGRGEGCALSQGEEDPAIEATATALVTVKLTASGDLTGTVKNLEVQEEEGYRDLACLACGASLPDTAPREEAR
jgi:hypothetical protein